METFHFIAKIEHCVEVQAENEAEAREKALEEFNDGERLSEIIITAEDIELEGR